MDLIAQAIFTSAETDRSAGYQVVATSPGVSETDARELAVWCPSHNALLDPGPNAVSYNFHPLPSGRYCASRTTPAGREYSGRRGARIYTQCLIVPPETLSRFANNPFALLRAALAAGALQLHDRIPERLSPLRLAGRAAAVDSALLARLRANPGPDWLASLVQAALTSSAVAVVGGPPAEHLIAGLINCLPPECRPEYSFSTGLRFSSRRPFRVVALSEDWEERRRIKRLYDVAVLDLSQTAPSEFAPVESWARFIHRALKSGRTSLLAQGLSRRQCEFAPEDLPALGLQLLEELDASSFEDNAVDADERPADVSAEDSSVGQLSRAGWCDAGDGSGEPSYNSFDDAQAGEDASEHETWLGQLLNEGQAVGHVPYDNDQIPNDSETLAQLLDEASWGKQSLWETLAADGNVPPEDVFPKPPHGSESWHETWPHSEFLHRTHKAHRRSHDDCCPPDAAEQSDAAPLQSFDPDDSDVLEKLERLDDLVYDAIKGTPAAMEQLKAFWSDVRHDLYGDLLTESQEQYLRYALSTWIESIEPEGVRDPVRAIHSLEVLCVLFDQI